MWHARSPFAAKISPLQLTRTTRPRPSRRGAAAISCCKGKMFSPRADLKEDFRQTPKDADASAGQSVRLDCQAPRGHPEPKLRWMKDGSDVKEDAR